MSGSTVTTPAPVKEPKQEVEYGLMDILLVVARHKKLTLGIPVAAVLCAVVVSLVLPNVYRASTRLLPPQQSQSGAAALLSQLGGLAGAAGAAGVKSPNDLYVGMLKSRTVADHLVAQFDLKKAYGTPSQEKARAILEENTVITSGKDGLLSIEVEDEDQKKVAPMANAYVNELLKLTKVLAVTEASQRRVFFEQQLEASKNRLASAEMALKRALDTQGVISVDASSRAIVETVGRLRAQISAKEIQLSSMQAFVTAQNPEYRRVSEELSSLRRELGHLENGRAQAVNPGEDALAKSPGLENIKILRDVKYHQMLYELLAKQYEVARLDEAKDPSIIQVLDPAVEPEQKFKPKRAVLVLLSGVFGLLAGIAAAFISDARGRAMRSPEGRARWEELRSSLRMKRGS